MSLSEELADLVKENVPEAPELQKVEVTNWPDTPAPVVNVTVPEVKVPEIKVPEPKVTVNIPEQPAPIVEVNTDLSEVVAQLADVSNKLSQILSKESPEFDYKEFERIAKANKSEYKGGAIGPSKVFSTIRATQDSGRIVDLAATEEGHLEVAIHSPRLPFGSVHTERLTPVIQSDGVYGINSFSMVTSTGLGVGTGANSASVTASGNKLVLATGATQYSFASLQSRRRLRYRAGQGVVGRFTAVYSTPVASSYLVAGYGTAETTLAFGYNGTAFGILYSTGGVREIHTFTVTTASTATNDYVVTLPNSATVNVTATNNSSTTQTAYEISLGTFPGWKAMAVGATVVFVADSAGNKSGSFSLAQTGAVTPAAGTDAETLAGVAATDTWIPQSSWNGDKCDGAGGSRFTLDPSKGNVYQIGIQYLGFGSITFQIEVPFSNANNPEFVTVHTIKYPNTATAVNLSQPSFPFLASAYSAGSTTDVSVSIGSFAGFSEGEAFNLGPRVSHQRDAMVTSSTSAYVPLFTVKNSLTFASRANQSVVKLLDVTGVARGNTNATTKFYLVRNAVLSGPVNFTATGAPSSTNIDTAATGMTAPSTSQILWSRAVTQAGDFEYGFTDREITLQPGESVTLCVKSLTATADCSGALNTREDQ